MQKVAVVKRERGREEGTGKLGPVVKLGVRGRRVKKLSREPTIVGCLVGGCEGEKTGSPLIFARFKACCRAVSSRLSRDVAAFKPRDTPTRDLPINEQEIFDAFISVPLPAPCFCHPR